MLAGTSCVQAPMIDTIIVPVYCQNEVSYTMNGICQFCHPAKILTVVSDVGKGVQQRI